MIRKLVQQGASTMMISLPAKWIQKNNLGKGSAIAIREERDELVLSTSEKTSKKDISITLETSHFTTNRAILVNFYRLGYDSIHIYCKNTLRSQLEEITAKYTPGYQLFENSKESYVIKSLTAPTNINLGELMRKIQYNVEWIFEILEKKNSGDWKLIENQLISLETILRRALSDKVQTETLFLWNYLHYINNGIKEIVKLFKLSKKPSSDEILFSKNIIYSVLKAFHEKDLVLVETIHSRYQEGEGLLKNKQLLFATKLFYLATSPLIGYLTLENMDY